MGIGIRKSAVLLLCVLFLWSLGGCATITRGPYQQVTFNSEPEGALIKIDDVSVGRTPIIIPVKRQGGTKQVALELEGFKTLKFALKVKDSGAAGLNGIFGVVGFIGLGVDAVSGRSNQFEDVISVVLEQGYGIVEIDYHEEYYIPPEPKEGLESDW